MPADATQREENERKLRQNSVARIQNFFSALETGMPGGVASAEELAEARKANQYMGLVLDKALMLGTGYGFGSFVPATTLGPRDGAGHGFRIVQTVVERFGL